MKLALDGSSGTLKWETELSGGTGLALAAGGISVRAQAAVLRALTARPTRAFGGSAKRFGMGRATIGAGWLIFLNEGNTLVALKVEAHWRWRRGPRTRWDRNTGLGHCLGCKFFSQARSESQAEIEQPIARLPLDIRLTQ
jgi:hypothetical protein